MQAVPNPSPVQRGRVGEEVPVATTRRRTLAAALAFLAAAFAPRPGLVEALRHHLPPGLDPYALGAALRAAHPTCTARDCVAQADLPTPIDLPARSAADFAAGRTISVNGWVLSHTEAWACAALA